MIHSTAIIDSKAEVDSTAEVGPYTVIDAGVVVGPECSIGPYVHLTGKTTIGSRNTFYAGSVIGQAPQDFKYDGSPTGLTIGDQNTFREGVTVHRSNNVDGSTVVGSSNYFMVNSHVGHNSEIGDQCVFANGALLGGHVTVADRVFMSSYAAVHQFIRIGRLTMLQGGSKISKDVPPFTITTGLNGLCGLNQVGLRRAEIPPEERKELKAVYRQLFLQDRPITQAAKAAQSEFVRSPSLELLKFVLSSSQGVCAHRDR